MRTAEKLNARHYAVLALLYVLFLYMSKMWPPHFIDMESGDYSLMFINHYVFPRAADLAGLGTNTTGRWSILIWNVYWPETYWLHVLGHVFVATIFFLYLHRWLRAANAPGWAGVALTLALALALARSVDVRFLLLAALVPMALPDLSHRRTSGLLLLLLVAVGLSAHVKGTFLLAAIACFVFLLGMELHNRRLPLNAAALLLAFFGWMTVAGIPWMEAWRQFALVQASGGTYGELFSGPMSPVLSALVILCMGGAGLIVVVTNVTKGLPGYLHIAIWGVLLFLIFKTSAVLPTGQHYIRWVLFLICVAIMFTARYWDRAGPALERVLGNHSFRFGTTALVLAALVVAAVLPEARAKMRTRAQDKVELMSRELRHLGAMVSSLAGGPDLAETHRAAVQRVRERTPLPVLPGPVGIYVNALATVPMAHDFKLRPLPVLNLDEGWTRMTIRENLAYLAGPSAPPYMLVRADGSADHVMLAIFEYYAPLSIHESLEGDDARFVVNGSFLLLRRRAEGTRVVHRLAGEAVLRWNEAVESPATGGDEFLVAEYAYRPTRLAKLLGFVYRPPVAAIEMLDDTGAVMRRRRLAAEVGPDGVVVSPYYSRNVQELAGAARWSSDGQPRGPITHSVRFVAGTRSGPDWLYGSQVQRWFAPTIDVRFRALRLVLEP